MDTCFKDLTVYKKAFQMAMEIFRITKSFPVEEKYSLTDQEGDLQELFVRILLKAIGKDSTKHIFYPKYQTLIWKTAKQVCGLISPLIVNI